MVRFAARWFDGAGKGSTTIDSQAPTIPPTFRWHDSSLTALGMVLTALAAGYMLHVNMGMYSAAALGWLTVSLILCVATIALGRRQILERIFSAALIPALILGIIIDLSLSLNDRDLDNRILAGLVFVAVLGLLQALRLRRSLRIVLLGLMLIAFCIITFIAIATKFQDIIIDVRVFEQLGVSALLKGANPYAIRYPNIYPPGTPFYGAGIVDARGMLTVGFPYPPLTLLLEIPGKVLGNDPRYAHAAAIVLSAGLLAAAARNRAGALAGCLLLLTPRTFYVLELAWTEPLLLLTFSMMMYCACRWRAGLPYALGLFLSTKQYSILALPLLGLLVAGEAGNDAPAFWRRVVKLLAPAVLVGVVINLPFMLWNVHEFLRAIVLFQFLQPFRTDALSYLAWAYRQGHEHLPLWLPLIPTAPAIGLAAWRCARTPAGFAAGLTLVNLVFFAFNKQAFCNYYYFVIGTACWSIAATSIGRGPAKRAV